MEASKPLGYYFVARTSNCRNSYGQPIRLATMRKASNILEELLIPHETKIVSAHRTPKRMAEYADTARGQRFKIIIAGAGGSAHLPGMIAAQTSLPVLGVPIESSIKGDGQPSINSTNAKGVPVGTLAIGAAGAENAALLAVSILSTEDEEVTKRLSSGVLSKYPGYIPSDDVC